MTLIINAEAVSGNVYLSEGGDVQAGHADVKINKGITTHTFTCGEKTLAVFWSPGEASIIINWIALYEGEDILPIYITKGYAAELLECQRYYYRVQPTDTYQAIFPGEATNGTTDVIIPNFFPKMHTTPTVNFVGSIIIRGVKGYCSDASFSAPYANPIFVVNKQGSFTIKKQEKNDWGNMVANAPAVVIFYTNSLFELIADL